MLFLIIYQVNYLNFNTSFFLGSNFSTIHFILNIIFIRNAERNQIPIQLEYANKFLFIFKKFSVGEILIKIYEAIINEEDESKNII